MTFLLQEYRCVKAQSLKFHIQKFIPTATIYVICYRQLGMEDLFTEGTVSTAFNGPWYFFRIRQELGIVSIGW